MFPIDTVAVLGSSEAAAACALLVDAAPGTPRAILARLAELLRTSAAVAAAGGASPAELARAIPYPGRVLALSLSLASGAVARLDVSAGPATTRHVLDRAAAFAARVNRAARRGEGP